jgi:hypothetical protein
MAVSMNTRSRPEPQGLTALVLVLDEMKLNPSLKLQQFQGCRAIIELLKSQANPMRLRTAAELNDAAEILVIAMLTHRLSVSVQSEACWALWHLATPSFVLDAVDCGVVDVLVDAISLYLFSPELCEAACRVLHEVTLDKEGRLQAYKLGVVDSLLAILRTHIGDGNVTEQACWVLLNLSIHDEHRKAIERRGGQPLIISAMKAHPDRISCCLWIEKLHAAGRRPPRHVQLLRPRRSDRFGETNEAGEAKWTRLKAAKAIASMLETMPQYSGWTWVGEWNAEECGSAYAVLVPPDGSACVTVSIGDKPGVVKKTGSIPDPRSDSEQQPEQQPEEEDEEEESDEDKPIILTPRSAAKEAAKRKEALKTAVNVGHGDKSKRELRTQLRKIKLGVGIPRPSLQVMVPQTPQTHSSWAPSPLPSGIGRVRRGGFINPSFSNTLNSIHASADGKEIGRDRINSTTNIFFKDLHDQVDVTRTVTAFKQRLGTHGVLLPQAPHKLEDVESAVGHLLKELEELKDLNRHL